jgi:hypothetical protein
MVEVQLLFALGTAAPPESHPPAAPRAGGATGDTARGCWGLGFDPDSLHVATTCSFPPGSFLGAIQRLFFDVWYARSSAIARMHIGATCWLVIVRLYNLKRPKSQFWSTMGPFSMIGLQANSGNSFFHPLIAALYS